MIYRECENYETRLENGTNIDTCSLGKMIRQVEGLQCVPDCEEYVNKFASIKPKEKPKEKPVAEKHDGCTLGLDGPTLEETLFEIYGPDPCLHLYPYIAEISQKMKKTFRNIGLSWELMPPIEKEVLDNIASIIADILFCAPSSKKKKEYWQKIIDQVKKIN